jgi:nucleotide-binding universal stress UspA family protein
MMFKTIVLGLDGSKESQKAAKVAAELAGNEGQIIAVHVRELLIGRAGGQTLHVDEESIEADIRAQVQMSEPRSPSWRRAWTSG